MKDAIVKWMLTWSKRLLVYMVIALVMWNARRELRIFTASQQAKNNRIESLEGKVARLESRIALYQHALKQETEERKFLELKVTTIGKAQKPRVVFELTTIDEVHDVVITPDERIKSSRETTISDLEVISNAEVALLKSEYSTDIVPMHSNDSIVKRSFFNRIFKRNRL